MRDEDIKYTFTESEDLKNIWDNIEYSKRHSPEYLDAKYAELVSRIHTHRRLRLKLLVKTISSSAAVLFFAVFTYNAYFKDKTVVIDDETISFNIEETRVEVPKNDVTIKVGNEFLKINRQNIILSATDSTVNIQTENLESIKEFDVIEVLEVNVPNGHQFSMTLSDGTKVWFNSGSKMKYPSRFNEDIRRVEIEGEVYFDVKRDEACPFIVSVDNRYDIEVLGTEFNVKSFHDQRASHTTLVNGKVSINLKNEDKNIELSPSDQYLIEEDNNVDLRQVNTENFTSWRERKFVFINEPLEQIAHEMARCYDIDIDVNDKYKKHRFTGRVDYNRGIDYFIKLLKDIQNINSVLQDNKLIIGT